jgi:hypothetical protein
MDDVSTYAVTQVLWREPVMPAYTEIASRVRYWRNQIYLGIGALSLTWPVAAFLRSL